MQKIILFFLVMFFFNKGFCQVADTVKTTKDSVAAVTPSQTATKKDMRPLKERIDFGFGSSFWFTPSQTYIEVAPVLAYRFPKTLITGMGYRYIYRHNHIYGLDLNAYGPNFFARVNLTRRIYFWTEYEILQNQYIPQVVGVEVPQKSTTTTNSWFAGLGYMRSFGKKGRGGISLQVLYNFLYTRDNINPYYAPVTYRVGYFF